MRLKLKWAASWCVALAGFAVGILGLVALGFGGAGEFSASDGWDPRWVSAAGLLILAITFLSASWVAVRNRGSAGLIFLRVLPVGAFCIAYPTSASWRWDPIPLPVVGLFVTLAFYLPLLLRRFGFRYRWTVAPSAVFGVGIFGASQWATDMFPGLVGWVVFYLVFALFWRRTEAWPPLRSNPRSPVAAVGLCFAVVCLTLGLTFTISALQSSLYSPHCSGTPLIVQPVPAGHVVFTARTLMVGRSLEALFRPLSSFRDPRSGLANEPRAGDWAIAVVEEDFGGFYWWEPRWVLLLNFVYWKGETYFLDGRREYGWLARLLPIIDANIGCGRTRPAAEAIVDLRVLRQRPSAGTRLIGSVRPPASEPVKYWVPRKPQYSAGAKIRVTGPSGTRMIETDQTGVYQVDDLPEGEYSLELLTRDDQLVGFFEGDSTPAKVHLKNRQPAGYNFEVFWNGRIEGQVTDGAGKPVGHVPVSVLKADGGFVPAFANTSLQTEVDGSYRFRKIPPGRYRVTINASGPSGQSPQDVQIYPRVIAVTEGQRLSGIDFIAPRLSEHAVEVKVSWKDGRSAENVPVCVAYENADDYENPIGSHCLGYTDRSGSLTIKLYGKTRVRLFSDYTDYHGDKPITYRSQRAENRADAMPGRMELVFDGGKADPQAR